MKRILCALLAGMMILSALAMISCEKEPEPTPDEQPSDTTTPEPNPDDTPDPEEAAKKELEEQQLKHDIEHYNYMIGTQAFSPGYQFTDQSPLMELAEQIDDWGSNMIKFYATNDNMID